MAQSVSLALPRKPHEFLSKRASRLPWLATPSSWDSSCQRGAAWPPAAWPPAAPALSGKRKCVQHSPLTQTFKSKHSKATGRARVNRRQRRKAVPQETKGVFKKLPLLPKEPGSKAAAIPLACVLSGAGWLRPQAFEEEMPSLVQAASQPPVLKVTGQWRGGGASLGRGMCKGPGG